MATLDTSWYNIPMTISYETHGCLVVPKLESGVRGRPATDVERVALPEAATLRCPYMDELCRVAAIDGGALAVSNCAESFTSFDVPVVYEPNIGIRE
jgi:hypothetical protein